MKNKLVILLLIIISLSVGSVVSASNDTLSLTKKNFTFTPQVGIPGSIFQTDKEVNVGVSMGSITVSTLLADYIMAFYIYALNILGILVVLVLMAGGVQWLVSGGNTQKIESAKKMITNSLFGGLLVVGSYFILNFINPDLTKLSSLEMLSIEAVPIADDFFGCCEKTIDTNETQMTTLENCTSGTFFPGYLLNGVTKKCELEVCYLEYGTNNQLISCTPGLEGSQTTGHGLSVTKKPCNQIGKCDNVVSNKNCQGVKDGEAPERKDEDGKPQKITGYFYYCFNKMIYTGQGKLEEPCGDGGGAYCKQSACPNDWTEVAVSSSQRSCINGLKCCKRN